MTSWLKMVGVSGTVAAVFCLAPPAGADPALGGQSAESVIADLQDQGYDVSINWVTGYDTKSLSQCWVKSIDNGGNQPPAEGTFTTVYVDVACPNGDDSGVSGGVGFGIG